MVGQKSSKKKNKNNPNLRGETNKKKVHDSEYCEKACGDNKCKMYEDYIYRVEVLFRIGNGLCCSK